MGLGKRAASAIAIVALMACSEGKATLDLGNVEAGFFPPEQTHDGGFDVDGGGSTVGPIVTVMTPLASRDPIAGPVLTGASVDVKCNVVQRDVTGPVDPTKVEIWVYAASVIDPVLKAPATLQGTDTFGASVALDLVPTGPVRFRCVAADKAAISQTGFGDVVTFYDAGPTITFTNLNAESIIAAGNDTANDLSIQFKVEPARLSALDSEADVAEVKLSISGREATLPVSGDFNYEQSVDFNSRFGGVPVDSVTIAVTATNKRTKAQATSKKQLIVRIDGVGPQIVVTSPVRPAGDAPIVGGTVRVEMTITDALAGVAQGSDRVFATIPYFDGDKTYPMTAGPSNTYYFTFEAGAFDKLASVTPQLHAFDKAGNETQTSYLMYLDTVAPWLSLVPGKVRECHVMDGSCSEAFEPLGASPKDGQVVGQSARFRALVWERGIEIANATETWISGVREGSVTFYAQKDPTVPLIVDTNNDGICDSINTSVSLDKVPFLIALGPVTPRGILPSTVMSELMGEPAVGGAWKPLMGTMPTSLCTGSEMSYVIHHAVSTGVSAVYASEAGGSLCTGGSIDPSGRGGWTCVTAAARDRAGSQGNLGIAKPIRVCRELPDSTEDCPTLPGDAVPMPPATLTCATCEYPASWLAVPYNRAFVYDP